MVRRRLQSGEAEARLPYPFHSAAELLEVAQTHGLTIDQVMMANECARMRVDDASATDEALAARVRAGIEAIWQTMKGCIERGIATEGILPGGLNVRRRAHRLAERLKEKEAIWAAERSAGAAGLGDGVCDGGERGERRRRPRGDGADEWSSGSGAGGGAVSTSAS